MKRSDLIIFILFYQLKEQYFIVIVNTCYIKHYYYVILYLKHKAYICNYDDYV